MPATDALQPPLTPAEREVCKSYGGWTNFMHSMGLKPWRDEDMAEGKAIIEAFARDNEADKASMSMSKNKNKNKK